MLQPDLQLLSFIAIATLFFISMAGLSIALGVRNRMNRVFGKTARTQEDLHQESFIRLNKTEQKVEILEQRTKFLEMVTGRAISKVGFRRYNPYAHTGGDQSFSLVLLDQTNSGMVLSSLYSRDGMRVYAKQIEHKEAKQPLSEEEKEVLEHTINRTQEE